MKNKYKKEALRSLFSLSFIKAHLLVIICMNMLPGDTE